MPDLLYRVEHPGSQCRFVTGLGILSKKARVVVEANPNTSTFSFPATVPSPKQCENADDLIMHLRKVVDESFATPFVSTTTDFFRVFSIAAKLVWIDSVKPADIKIHVITRSDVSGRDIVDANRFLADFQDEDTGNITDFTRVRNTIRVNNEVVIRRRVPPVAIRTTHTLEELMPLLPDWMKSDDLQKLVSYPDDFDTGHVRTWNRKVESKRTTNTRQFDNWTLSVVLLGPHTDADDVEKFENMIEYGPRLV